MSAKVKDITVSASVGGNVQIVKFQYTSKFHYSTTFTYEIEDMTEEEAKAFRDEKLKEMREDLEPIAQEEVDELLRQRELIRSGGEDPDS